MRSYTVTEVLIQDDKDGKTMRVIARKDETGYHEDIGLFFPSKLVKQMQKAGAEVKKKKA